MSLTLLIPVAIVAYGVYMLCHRSKDLPQRPISRILCATPFFIAASLGFAAIQLPVGSDWRVMYGIAAFGFFFGGQVVFAGLAEVLDQWGGTSGDWEEISVWLLFIFVNIILPVVIFVLIK